MKVNKPTKKSTFFPLKNVKKTPYPKVTEPIKKNTNNMFGISASIRSPQEIQCLLYTEFVYVH